MVKIYDYALKGKHCQISLQKTAAIPKSTRQIQSRFQADLSRHKDIYGSQKIHQDKIQKERDKFKANMRKNGMIFLKNWQQGGKTAVKPHFVPSMKRPVQKAERIVFIGFLNTRPKNGG